MARESDEAEQSDPIDDPLHIVIGQDDAGQWIVEETHGLCGGIFSSKDAALRFAKSETADRKGNLAMTSDRLEFRPPRRGRR